METTPIIIVFLVLGLGLSILTIVAEWKIYQKAGKPGWACIVPIYNTLVLLEIVGKPWWWIFLMMIPVVNLIFTIWVINLLSKSFGKDESFTLGLIFLSVIFFCILGFGKAQYQGPAGKQVN